MSQFSVHRDCALLEFLSASWPEMKRKTLKDRLKNGAVTVNGEVCTQHDTPLSAGDRVALYRKGAGAGGDDGSGIRVLYEDDALVAIHKPSGLLSVAAQGPDRGKVERTALTLTSQRLLGAPRLLPCHRLDRETSGVMLLAKSKDVQERVFAHWQEAEKRYHALVEGVLKDDEGRICAALREEARSLAVQVSTRPEAKSAATRYRVLSRGRRRTLLELTLETGRKHQIRVHLQHIGHPVLGDTRYGADKKSGSPLCLHAHRLSLAHPFTEERLVFEVPTPGLFQKLLAG